MVRFKRHDWDGVTSLSAILKPKGPLHGIYILEFDDGTEYVGKTANFLSRFNTHKRHQEGRIVAFSFGRVARRPRGLLDEEERATIQARERDGARLRNLDLVHLPQSSEALDLVIDKAVQDAWLKGETTGLVLGTREHRGEPTATQVARNKELSERPYYPWVVVVLADYLAEAVPWPHKTERRFWTVTAYPATGRTDTRRRAAAITINNVETLVCMEFLDEPGGEWEPMWFLNVHPEVELPLGIRDLAEIVDAYATVGPVMRIYGSGSFEDSPEVAAAARRLAIGLLRKGQSMMSRYHNPLLADDLFADLQQQLNTPPA